MQEGGGLNVTKQKKQQQEKQHLIPGLLAGGGENVTEQEKQQHQLYLVRISDGS